MTPEEKAALAELLRKYIDPKVDKEVARMEQNPLLFPGTSVGKLQEAFKRIELVPASALAGAGAKAIDGAIKMLQQQAVELAEFISLDLVMGPVGTAAAVAELAEKGWKSYKIIKKITKDADIILLLEKLIRTGLAVTNAKDYEGLDAATISFAEALGECGVKLLEDLFSVKEEKPDKASLGDLYAIIAKKGGQIIVIANKIPGAMMELSGTKNLVDAEWNEVVEKFVNDAIINQNAKNPGMQGAPASIQNHIDDNQ